jgi:hypothetical protein
LPEPIRQTRKSRLVIQQISSHFFSPAFSIFKLRNHNHPAHRPPSTIEPMIREGMGPCWSQPHPLQSPYKNIWIWEFLDRHHFQNVVSLRPIA